jgi:hypothetical protein
VRINLRGREIRVPQHRLDEAGIGTVFQHVRGAGMPSISAEI